jgi:hypothetical protein
MAFPGRRRPPEDMNLEDLPETSGRSASLLGLITQRIWYARVHRWLSLRCLFWRREGGPTSGTRLLERKVT